MIGSTSEAVASERSAPAAGRGRIDAEGLTRRFGTKLALAPLTLSVGPGGITGLLGPNGSGKSTLLRCLVGLVPADAGSATVDGARLSGDGVAVRRRVTYAPGELHLYGELSGAEHLDWLLRGRGRAARARGRELARELGLPLAQKVRGYSHGMKRQLCFAAALAPELGVRLLDEPTEGLDPSKRSQVLDLLEADAARGTTILLSSHHLGEVDRVCDRLLFLSDGKLIADETPESVHERAARLLRLVWPAGSDPSALAGALRSDAVESIRVEGTRMTVLLAERDPRRFLARLEQRSLPAPSAIEYGRLSLSELYTDLYGVEGT